MKSLINQQYTLDIFCDAQVVSALVIIVTNTFFACKVYDIIFDPTFMQIDYSYLFNGSGDMNGLQKKKLSVFISLIFVNAL